MQLPLWQFYRSPIVSRASAIFTRLVAVALSPPRMCRAWDNHPDDEEHISQFFIEPSSKPRLAINHIRVRRGVIASTHTCTTYKHVHSCLGQIKKPPSLYQELAEHVCICVPQRMCHPMFLCACVCACVQV